MSHEYMRPAERIIRRAVLGVLMSTTCLFSTPGRSQDDDLEEQIAALKEIPREYTINASTVESGVYFLSQDTYRFGTYTGLDEDGLQFLGNMDIWKRVPYDDPSARDLRIQALNLGLDSRLFRFSYGDQGRYRLSLFYNELPVLESDSGFTFLGPNKGSFLNVPPGWVASDTPAGMTALNSSLYGLDVDHKRKDLGGEFSVFLSEGWELETRFDRGTKQGTKLAAALVGSSGGNPRSVLVPEPIDYGTGEINIDLRYADETSQLQLGYYFSSFDNRREQLSWEVPYLRPAGSNTWDPAADFAAGAIARKGVAPDNRFDQLSLSGGYNLPAHTRITLSAAAGRMKQDESYLPYTSNPTLAASITTPLPEGDLDGEIDTTFLKLAITSRPFARLSLKASYRLDDRDNDTSRDLYVYIPGDSQLQDTATSGTARYNHPYSYTENEIGIGARYRLARRTDVLLDYEFEEIKRNFSEVDKTREDKFRARLTTRPTDFLTARVNLAASSRDGNTYEGEEPFFVSHTAGFIASEPVDERFENHPLLRRHYLADRRRNEAGLHLTVMPTEALNVGIKVDLIDDDYDRTFVGLQDRKMTSYSLDLSFSPADQFDCYGFYNYEQIRSDQGGWSFQGFAKATQAADPDRIWSVDQHDDIHTWGIGVARNIMGDRLRLGADYLFTRSTAGMEVDTGPALTAGPSFPDAITRLHNFRFGAEYRLREDLTVKVAYLFEKFDWSDWTWDGVTPANLDGEVITTADRTPDERASVLALSFIYKFF